MKRRRLLAVLATGSIAVPGCLSESDGAGDGSPTPTQTPTGTAPDGTSGPTPTGTSPGSDAETPTGTGGEFVSEAFAVPELVGPNSPDSFGVHGDRDEQYVVALLDGSSGSRPAVEDVTLVADGTAHEARTSVGYSNWALFDYDGPYSPEDGRDGWVVFPLSNPLDAESAAITWPGGEYPLGESVLAALARPPTSFAVRSFEAPATASVGETITLSLAVENTGDADGTFVGAVNRNFPAYAPVASIRLSVAAGETASWEREVTVGDMGYEGSDGELRFWLYWRGDPGERETTVDVGIAGPGTTTGSGEETGTADGMRTRTTDGRKTGTALPETATETPSGTPTPPDE